MKINDYEIVKRLPVARFFYKGQSHTHPVRRTVLLIEADGDKLTGFEVREGREVRVTNDAPIKTYSRKKIAKVGEIDLRRALRRNVTGKDLENTTLTRAGITDLRVAGA